MHTFRHRPRSVEEPWTDRSTTNRQSTLVNRPRLAAAVLDEEAAAKPRKRRRAKQVIFPDDLLPGVNSEPVTFHEAFARGGG